MLTRHSVGSVSVAEAAVLAAKEVAEAEEARRNAERERQEANEARKQADALRLEEIRLREVRCTIDPAGFERWFSRESHSLVFRQQTLCRVARWLDEAVMSSSLHAHFRCVACLRQTMAVDHAAELAAKTREANFQVAYTLAIRTFPFR
jgi:hypothetical protein